MPCTRTGISRRAISGGDGHVSPQAMTESFDLDLYDAVVAKNGGAVVGTGLVARNPSIKRTSSRKHRLLAATAYAKP